MDVDIDSLDFGTLCYLVGLGFNERVVTLLAKAGYPEARASYGFVIQHLLEGGKSVSQLASRLGITQQATSKRVRQMLDAGVLEATPGADRRELRVTLSPRGRDIVQATRRLRDELATEVLAQTSIRDRRLARAVLVALVDRLGLTAPIQQRRIREAR